VRHGRLRVEVAQVGERPRVAFMAGARTYTFSVWAKDVVRNGASTAGLLRVRVVKADGPLSVVEIPTRVGERLVAVPSEALVPDDARERALVGWALLAFVAAAVVAGCWGVLHVLGG
jgi:hypothetical protein